MTRPTYEECRAAGMTITETAKARGVSIQAVSRWAKRNGVMFAGQELTRSDRMRKLHADPEFAKAHAERAAERMRKLNANPEFAKAHAERAAERMRKLHANPEFNPLAALNEDERADYDVLKKAGYTRDEAFRAIGRGDLARREAAA